MIIKEYQKNILHKFIVEYYKYLSTWNKSASLISMIESGTIDRKIRSKKYY